MAFIGAATLALVASVVAVDVKAGAAVSQAGVSLLDYSPKPLRGGDKLVRVRFTTTGPAPRGRVYAVWISTGLGNQSCYLEAPYVGPPIKGAPGRTYTVAIRSNAQSSGASFCTGRARIQVSTELVVHDSDDGPRRRVLKTLWFRIR